MAIKVFLIPLSFNEKNRERILLRIKELLEGFLKQNGIEAEIEVGKEVQIEPWEINRERYVSAESFIGEIGRPEPNVFNIGITPYKIVTTDSKQEGMLLGKSVIALMDGRPIIKGAVVSIDRPFKEINNKFVAILTVTKTILHELGHCFSPSERYHCSDRDCIMYILPEYEKRLSLEIVRQRSILFCKKCREKIGLKPQQ